MILFHYCSVIIDGFLYIYIINEAFYNGILDEHQRQTDQDMDGDSTVSLNSQLFVFHLTQTSFLQFCFPIHSSLFIFFPRCYPFQPFRLFFPLYIVILTVCSKMQCILTRSQRRKTRSPFKEISSGKERRRKTQSEMESEFPR